MKLRLLTLPLGALALAAVSSAQFANQTLAVVSLGNDGSTLANTGNQVTLVNFAKTGAAQAGLGSAVLPIFLSGTATSEGFLISDGSNPSNLAIAGYSTSFATSVVAATGTQVPRRVTQFNTITGVSTSTNLGANDFSTTNPRSAQVIGTTILAAGPNVTGVDGGVLTGAFNGTSSDLSPALTTTGSIRLVQRIEGTTYFSTNTNVFTGPAAGTPAMNTGSIFGTNATGLTSAYDFLFTDANTLYFADDSGATTGGLLRSVRGTDGFFTTAVKIGTVPTIRHLSFDGTTLFATTAEGNNNSLISFGLDGSNLTTLASAGVGRAFRGVEVVPEPATMAAMALGLGALAARRRRKSA